MNDTQALWQKDQRYYFAHETLPGPVVQSSAGLMDPEHLKGSLRVPHFSG